MAARAKLPIISCLLLLVLVANAVDLKAQGHREKIPLNASGTLQAVAPGKMIIKAAGDEMWMVTINKATEIHVVGTAVPEFLRPGMFVKFKANLDQKGRAQEPIGKLTIATPSETEIPGAFPDQGAAGFGAGGGAANAGGGEGPPVSAYQVFGQIRGIDKKGKMSVFCGPAGAVTVELAENPEIEVDVADLRLASQGDKVMASGTMSGERMGTAKLIDVELSKPLGPPEDDNKKRRTRRRRDRDDDEQKTDEASAEEKKDDEKAAKEKKDDEGDKPDDAKPAADNGGSEYLKLAELLTLDPADAAGKPTVTANLGPGKKIVLKPSVRGPATTLKKRFGEPTKKNAFAELMPPQFADRLAGWEVWAWGPVHVVIDSKGYARFFAVEE